MSVITVLEKLAPHVEEEVNLIFRSKEEAETLRRKLERIQAGLQDAERQGITNPNVKLWLKELEDVMYEMEDALDKWETKNLESQIEQSEYDDISDPWEKVRVLFMCLCSRFKRVVGRRGLTQEMKDLSARLERILSERETYNLVPNRSDSSRELKKPETTSPVDESERYIGRDSEVERLVGWLLSEGEGNGSQIFSIVGVGGLGKTTVARMVYNDPRVEDHFDLNAWVSVPNPFDASHVAKAILEDFGKSASTEGTLENLGRRIKAAVSKKFFFVVLDDVWTVDPAEWKSLKNFLVSEPGCRILVTTRDEKAARIMGTHWRRLNSLSDSDCAELILNGIALGGRSEDFRRIGSEIAKKCNGLPLAAKTLGRMLESKFTVREWEEVLESPLWKYEDEMSDVFRALRLSYMDLSPVLKRCFLSCVLYSKGSRFYSDLLTRIWVAQGYISSSATWDQVQSKGNEYFRILCQRSFFQELEIGVHYMTCKMHDLMHEFASYLSRSEYYFILDRRPHPLPIDSRTRSFGAISVSLECPLSNFISLLKSVRVLCLGDCGMEELSEEVGELIHLRYLDLSRNPIKELPETVCNLYNLQILDLQLCDHLSRLPHGIGKLMKLRQLHTCGTKLVEFPQGLQKLTNLWILDQVIVTKDTVGCLRNLNQLSGHMWINVKGLKEAAEAEKANLRDKVHIQDLGITFSDDVTNDAVEALVPPPQLQSLLIDGYGNQQLPSWITTKLSLNNLKSLQIFGFGDCHCSDLHPLGKLPMLELLKLRDMKFRRVTVEFLGVVIPKGTSSTAMPVDRFPKLKILQIVDCGDWEEWEDLQEEEEADSVPISTIPCLQTLVIEDCPKLLALPHNLLRAASTLQMLIVSGSNRLESRYREELGADRRKISQIPGIYI